MPVPNTVAATNALALVSSLIAARTSATVDVDNASCAKTYVTSMALLTTLTVMSVAVSLPVALNVMLSLFADFATNLMPLVPSRLYISVNGYIVES